MEQTEIWFADMPLLNNKSLNGIMQLAAANKIPAAVTVRLRMFRRNRNEKTGIVKTR